MIRLRSFVRHKRALKVYDYAFFPSEFSDEEILSIDLALNLKNRQLSALYNSGFE